MHTKRISIGKGKKPRWFAIIRAGSQKKENSLTMLYILRDVLKYADNSREASRILNNGLVSVNKKVIKEPNYTAGLMDVVEILKVGKYYRILPSGKGPKLREITEQEAKIKPCRIVNKQSVKNGKIQLNLHDGTTLLIEKNTFKTKDTLILEIPSRKIKEVLEYKKGNVALICQGRHSGETGVISQITEGTESGKSKTKVGDIETMTDYVFVIGKEKPLIAI
ncbi:MAG: 30S ribosomal protein S4e [Candidatus Altiarchaeales archaeon]|nr:30S ribosomal protein S4e [Candidatus Altiarchaeales archaeon]